MHATMDEVAKAAGVSKATVSRILNEHPYVSPEAVEKVQAAIKELDYKPRLKRHGIRSGSIGLLLVEQPRQLLRFSTESDIFYDIGDVLTENNLQLALIQVHDSHSLPSTVSPKRLDGALVVGRPSSEIRSSLRELNCVLLFSGVMDPGDEIWADWVTPDYNDIGKQAARYLSGKGHKRLALLNPQAGHLGFCEVEDGFKAVARSSGLELELFAIHPHQKMRILDEDIARQAVGPVLQKIFSRPETKRPTGLLVCNDFVTVQAIRILEEMGIRPGHDVDIVTTENEARLLTKLENRPVAFDLDPVTMARRAVEKLLYRIKYPEEVTYARTLVSPKLIEPNYPEINWADR